ncbi:MAG: MFS transporter [Actinomycetota bacterium]|nr:MFS transporter [Actinomycetota bacterium]
MEGGQPHFVRSGRVLVLLLSAFGVFGLWAGCFTVLLADLSRALGLSPGPLGVALFAGAAASIAAMASLGWSADRFGRKAFLVVVASVFACGIGGLALAGSFVALVLVFVLVFSAGGLYDVGINATAVDLEQATGRRFMSFLHAAYSGGAVVGALGAGTLLSVGVGYRFIYLALLAPLVALVVAVAAARLPRAGGARGEASSDAAAEGAAASPAGRWELYRSVPLLLVAAIAVFGLLAEGEMGHWSGIYLRDSLGVGALLGGSGVAAFYGAMALGRLATGWTVGRLGNRHTLLGAGLLVAFGMALALATTSPSLVIVGFLVVGLALAAIAPLAFSVAGDLVPQRAASAISVVTTFGYGGFLLGPPLVGGLAEVVGLRMALGLIAVAGLCVFVLSLRLGEDREKSIPS